MRDMDFLCRLTSVTSVKTGLPIQFSVFDSDRLIIDVSNRANEVVHRGHVLVSGAFSDLAAGLFNRLGNIEQHLIHRQNHLEAGFTIGQFNGHSVAP